MTGISNQSFPLPQMCLFLGLVLHVIADGPLGIPGTTQTISGYDTELGSDPICWSSQASATGLEGIPFPNGELVEDFSLANEVVLAPSCPNGTWIEAFAPPEFLEPNFRPRTLEWYNYTIKGAIALDELSGVNIVSDEGSRISIGVVACDSIRAGFCSPFVHEQANIRENSEMEQYGYTLFAKQRVTGDRHGGTHVHAPAIIMDVESSLREVEFEVEVPIRINDPGTFFVIGTLQFFMGDFLDKPRYRYDVANALSLVQNERLVTYQEQAKILEVSEPIRIVSYCAVGLAASVILYLLFQLIKHYKSQVLQMSQAPFLMVFLLAALVATLFSLLFDPRNDWMCLLAYPVAFTSLQLMFAVTLGRLWRINALVSPLLRNRLQRTPSKRNINSLFWAFCPSRRTNIRREITNTKVALIIALCTSPQIALQILSIALQPSQKAVDFNADESTGRCVCDDGVKAELSISFYAMLVLFLLILVLLAMAHAARQLPSLLNESSVIYDVTGTSALLAILGIGVIAITDDPSISPDVSYLVHIVIALSMTLNSSIRIMMPKLKMAWNGHVVIVSQLVADHKQSLNNATLKANPKSLMHNVTGLNMNSKKSDPTSLLQYSWSRTGFSHTVPSGVSNDDVTESHNHDSIRPENFATDKKQQKQVPQDATEQLQSDSSSNKSASSQYLWTKTLEERAKDDTRTDAESRKSCPAASSSTVKFGGKKKRSSAGSKEASPQPNYLIREGEVPSRRLTVQMLDLQDELDLITNRILSGLEVARGDWERVRHNTEQLDEVFSLVRFDWESTKHEKSDDRNGPEQA